MECSPVDRRAAVFRFAAIVAFALPIAAAVCSAEEAGSGFSGRLAESVGSRAVDWAAAVSAAPGQTVQRALATKHSTAVGDASLHTAVLAAVVALVFRRRPVAPVASAVPAGLSNRSPPLPRLT